MGLRLSEDCKELLVYSNKIAQKNNFWGVEHFFLALIEKNRQLVMEMLEYSGVDGGHINYILEEMDHFCWSTSEEPVWRNFITTPRMEKLGRIAEKEALDSRAMRIEPLHYLKAIIKDGRGVVPLSLRNSGLNLEELLEALTHIGSSGGDIVQKKRNDREDSELPSEREINKKPLPSSLVDKYGKDKKEERKESDKKLKKESSKGVLEKYGRDLVALAREKVYKINDETLEKLKTSGLSEEKLKQLNRMKNRELPEDPIKRKLEFKKLKFSEREIELILNSVDKQEKVDPVVGRGEETLKMIQVLTRRGKNNPVIIGEPGVGKTALVMALAQRIARGKVPDMLKNKRVIELSMSSLVAGAKHRGDFEERLEKLLKVTTGDPDIILFVDEIHTIVGAGDSKGGMDAANILKPALARGEISLIGATTIDEYKYIEKDPALERRFQPVQVNEPSEADTVEILKALRPKLESHHNVDISDEALAASVKLSMRYLTERYLPDKAIDIIDEACSSVKVRQASSNLSIIPGKLKYNASTGDVEGEETSEAIPLITDKDVAQIISLWTAIPVTDLTTDESIRLAEMENTLKDRVKGQDKAVHKVCQVVKMARLGLASPGKPQGVFLFLGSTGVGKTELAKGLAEFIFGTEDDLIRLDMSEYKEKHSISKLIGAPAGYVGHEDEGRFTKSVRTKPYSVVLLDEVEKAHPEVFDIFLQVFDEGRLTDQRGRVINFCNTIIIMTSNLAVDYDEILKKVEEEKQMTGDGWAIDEDLVEREKICEKLQSYFRPEFLNRIDEIIVFNPLEKESLKSIASININSFLKRLREEKAIDMEVKEEVLELILKYGYNPRYGARPLKRTVQRFLINAFAQELLKTSFKQGDRVCAIREGDRVVFVPHNEKENLSEKVNEKRDPPSSSLYDDLEEELGRDEEDDSFGRTCGPEDW